MNGKNPPIGSFLFLFLFLSVPLTQGHSQPNPSAESDVQASQPASQGSQVSPLELPEVTVVGVTPIPSVGLPPTHVAGNVQSAEDEDIHRLESLNLAQFLNRQLNDVTITEFSENPFQPDILYRGFFASPVIGTPIGISIYQDGVRINEPFADVILWDLVPRVAIANLDLIPGSNPLFGLNTLGGSLSLRTKSGFSHPGTQVESYAGSFGRKFLEVQHGGSQGPFDWFFGGDFVEEDGWRKFSPSNLHQFFAKAGYQEQGTDVDLSYTFAKNKLLGLGLTPESFLAIDPANIYTAPDPFRDELHMVTLNVHQEWAKDWTFAATTYYRGNSIDSLGGDVAENADQFRGFGFPLDAQAFDEEGNIIPAAVLHLVHLKEDQGGATLQFQRDAPFLGKENLFIAGMGWDYGQSYFTQANQPAGFSVERITIPIAPVEAPRFNVRTIDNYGAVYFTDTFSLAPFLHLTPSLRWQWAEVNLAGFGTDEEGVQHDLGGTHVFDRVNPAVGITCQPLLWAGIEKPPLQDLTVYFDYNEGFRIPTPVELVGANPAVPVLLPNAFLSDPPLAPVVARTYEVGMRGKFGEAGMQWNLSFYRIDVTNDILFLTVPGPTAARGFFQNIAADRRDGVEVGIRGSWQKLHYYANWSFCEATYQTTATLMTNQGPETIHPGDRIPSIPQQLAKVGVEYELLPGWLLGADLQYVSTSFLRSDDANRFPTLPEYVILNVQSRYRISPNVEVFALATNVLNERFFTTGMMLPNFFTGTPGGGTAERFLAPGAPIGGWAGLRIHF
ncbi:TonB-dependent receptor [Candidatus Methylacidithermus pantelleriae]|nr:TonB-dependent receptor [Candidatus Methylacidithermus pantelleriae]